MKLDFLEIGTSDFDSEILRSNDMTCGISIEPIDFYLYSLPSYKNIIKINAAISDKNGFIEVYYIHPDDIKKFDLPNWIRGCNSIGHPHETVSKILMERKIDTSIVNKKIVKLLKLSEILDEYNVEYISYLKIDTEGHDFFIMKDYLEYCMSKNNCIANKIQFETNSLSNQEDIYKIKNSLKELKYKEITSGNLNSTFVLI